MVDRTGKIHPGGDEQSRRQKVPRRRITRRYERAAQDVVEGKMAGVTLQYMVVGREVEGHSNTTTGVAFVQEGSSKTCSYSG